jgi:hypothetical protein
MSDQMGFQMGFRPNVRGQAGLAAEIDTRVGLVPGADLDWMTPYFTGLFSMTYSLAAMSPDFRIHPSFRARIQPCCRSRRTRERDRRELLTRW